MIIYIMRDTEPAGGFYAAQSEMPLEETERRAVVEVRKTEVAEEFWQGVLAGRLPINFQGNNDETWLKLWEDAEPVWKRV